MPLYVPASAGGVTDHGALTGLGDDDHTAYATNVELTAHIDDATAAHAATAIAFTPAGTIAASTVQAAIEEVATEAATVAQAKTEVLIIACSDETTAITTGNGKATFRMPWAMTLTAVRASLTTASSSGIPTFDINEGGTTILSTKLTVDASEKTSTTAATPAVISDASLADDAEITVDFDVAGTGATGVKIYLIGTRA